MLVKLSRLSYSIALFCALFYAPSAQAEIVPTSECITGGVNQCGVHPSSLFCVWKIVSCNREVTVTVPDQDEGGTLEPTYTAHPHLENCDACNEARDCPEATGSFSLTKTINHTFEFGFATQHGWDLGVYAGHISGHLGWSNGESHSRTATIDLKAKCCDIAHGRLVIGKREGLIGQISATYFTVSRKGGLFCSTAGETLQSACPEAAESGEFTFSTSYMKASLLTATQCPEPADN